MPRRPRSTAPARARACRRRAEPRPATGTAGGGRAYRSGVRARLLPLALIALAALAGAALRLRFLDVPLNTDEGGYAQIARLWAGGERLYGDVAWVDRPQALLLEFRIAVGLGDDEAVRILALVAATAATLGVAGAAWALAGPGAAACAAALYAVVSPAPHLEGFTANGELLGGAWVALALAVGARALASPRPSPRLLVVAGALAALGPLTKQSAFDGALALVLLVAARALRGRDVAGAVRGLALLAAGAAVPVAAAVIHAATIGLGDWWWAIVGYRTGTESAVSGDTLHRLRLLAESLPPAGRDLLPLLILVPAGAVALRRGRRLALPALWALLALLGLLAGGLYHPHYWVQLVPPLAVLAGAGLASALAARNRPLLATAAVCALACAALQADAWHGGRTAISRATTADDRVLTAEPVGAALAAATAPGDRVYVVWANAAVYWHADRAPAFRYLWYRGVELIPGAREDVRALFAGPAPPAAVAVYQEPDALDATGTVARALATRYDRLPDVAGVAVYRLRST